MPRPPELSLPVDDVAVVSELADGTPVRDERLLRALDELHREA